MKTMDRAVAYKAILGTKGKFFSVQFIKKDGSLRKMQCRLGVKKYLKGGTYKAGQNHPELVPVYDVPNKGYRSINLETIKFLRISGIDYKVV